MQIFDRTKIMLFVIIFPGGCTEFPEISRFLATLSVQLPAVLLSHSNTRQRIHATASVHQPVEICGWLRSEAGKVTTGPAESNGSLLSCLWLTSPGALCLVNWRLVEWLLRPLRDYKSTFTCIFKFHNNKHPTQQKFWSSQSRASKPITSQVLKKIIPTTAKADIHQ